MAAGAQGASGHHRDRVTRPTVLLVIALGGMLGASSRYALERAWPAGDAVLPWATLGVNVSGCAATGVLMVYVVEMGGAHPLLRPFLGVGLLGGYTTFSTYAVQTHALLLGGHPAEALTYLVGTLLAALAALGAGVVLARVLRRVRRRLSWRRSRVGEERR